MTWTLYEGDCLDIMRGMPSESVDAVITDPPYGIDYQSNFRGNKFPKIANDKAVNIDWIGLACDKLKNGGAMYCCTRWDVLTQWEREIKKHLKIKNIIVWHKPGGGLGDLKGGYIYNHEFIIFAVKGRHILRGKRVCDVWMINKDNVNNYLHPTQKPVLLIETMIKKSTDEAGIILDPFAGSGTAAVACENTGRNSILIEKEPKYCNIIRERMNALQGRLII